MKAVLLIFLLILKLFGFEIIDLKKAKYYYETNSALFIDARDYRKYSKGTISKAINIPLKRYKRYKKFLPIDKNVTIVIFCGGINCTLSKKLSKKIERFGYTNIKQFEDGFPKWKVLKLPIMAKPIKCQNLKPKRVVINGVELFLNRDNSVNIEWLRNIIENKKLLSSGILLVDVREPQQFKKNHIEGAVNIPFINDSIDKSKLQDAKAIIFYCNSGIISANAKESLDTELKKRVFVVDEPITVESF